MNHKFAIIKAKYSSTIRGIGLVLFIIFVAITAPIIGIKGFSFIYRISPTDDLFTYFFFAFITSPIIISYLVYSFVLEKYSIDGQLIFHKDELMIEFLDIKTTIPYNELTKVEVKGSMGLNKYSDINLYKSYYLKIRTENKESFEFEILRKQLDKPSTIRDFFFRGKDFLYVLKKCNVTAQYK